MISSATTDPPATGHGRSGISTTAAPGTGDQSGDARESQPKRLRPGHHRSGPRSGCRSWRWIPGWAVSGSDENSARFPSRSGTRTSPSMTMICSRRRRGRSRRPGRTSQTSVVTSPSWTCGRVRGSCRHPAPWSRSPRRNAWPPALLGEADGLGDRRFQHRQLVTLANIGDHRAHAMRASNRVGSTPAHAAGVGDRWTSRTVSKQLADTAVRQGLGLQRDQHLVGGGERVDGQDSERGRAVRTGRSRSHRHVPSARRRACSRPVRVSRCASVPARSIDAGSESMPVVRWDAGPCRR